MTDSRQENDFCSFTSLESSTSEIINNRDAVSDIIWLCLILK